MTSFGGLADATNRFHSVVKVAAWVNVVKVAAWVN